MDNQFLKSYFASDYKGIDSIINEILIPIFGAQNFEEGYDLLTRPDSAFTKKAHTHHIQSVAYHGTIYAEGIELKVYDVTLDSRANIARSRVGIRQVVAEMVEQFDGAFIIFHYVDNTHRSWRLSYIEKIPGQKKSKRFTYLCGENFSCRTIAERLNELQKSPKNAKALETAFSVEALSNEFFSDYKHQYEIFCQYIEDNKQDNTRFGEEFATEEGKYIRDYVKKLMGRLTFLCFLQRRGWMGVPVSEKDWYGGDTQFIYNLFQKATPEQKDNFLDEVLEPLFFECLNEKREGDIYDTRVAAMGRVKIPYLNGGLFDREPIDNFRSVFPAKLFQDLFNFFASYNFTIDENDPNDAEVGVDPEMLGKIFENLLEDNKEKGAFYTPKEIVQYMCQEALINYLETETSLSKETIRLFAKSPEDSVKNIPEIEQDKLRKSLESVKICDPAIGSGAFPMELLNELLHCREALMDDPYNRADIKKSIIQNNIYGVDIEQGAIDIARLRFWLSIVVDEDTPSPLPNLDYKIMHGNSLLTTFNGKYLNINDNQKHANIQAIIAKKKSLQQKQKEYFLLNGQAKYEKEIDIKNLILDIIDLQLGYERNSFAIKQIQTGTLFGEDTPKQMSLAEIAKQKAPEKQATIDYCKVLRETLNDTTKSIEERARTKIPFFDWQIMFADVFNRSSNCNGFDIVIGNPPYIQLQNNGGELATMYAPCEFDTFARTGDIYCLFYEKGNKLLHDGGHLCYITSNKWMRAGYGEKTREFFANKTNPKLLIDFAGVKIFESATVDTNILLFQKAKNTHSTTCCVTKKLDKEGVKNLSDFVLQNSTQCAFTSSDSWVILSPIEQSIKRKIEAVGKPLKDWDIQINYGIKTGFNDAFFISTEKRAEILSACKTEEERKRTEELIRPILRGRDIKRYGYDWAGLWLINTHNGVKGKYPPIDINDYPAIKQHLDKYWDKISTRDDKGVTPYNLRNCAYLDDFNKPKVVYPETTQGAYFAFDEKNYFLDKTCFMLLSDSAKYLQLTLSSKLFEFAYKHIYASVSLGKEGYQYNKHALLKLPILEAANDILNTKNVDDLIYKLYNLNTTEIAYIENGES